MHWLAICNASEAPQHPRPLPPQPMPELLGTGSLVVELTLGAIPAAPLAILDYREHRGWARALSLTLATDGTLRLHQRQGGATAEVSLPLSFPREMQGLRVTYAWNAPARRSRLSAEVLQGGAVIGATGTCPLPIPGDDLARLFATGNENARHRSVSWMGLSSDENVTSLGAAISAGTPIRTPDGQTRADLLRAGDLVLTRDHGPQSLRWTGKLTLPAQGSFTPIRLRAPYFAPEKDLIVAPTQRLALSGTEVEYLFGEDEVLAGAHHFVNGRSALHETRRSFVTYVFLLFDRHEVIFAADCAIESLSPHSAAPSGVGGGADPARRVLHRYEAVSLRQMRDRSDHLTAA